MAFWNSAKDLWHDVTQIAQGHNPMNNPGMVGTSQPTGSIPGQQSIGAHSSGTTMTQTDPYGNPLDPGADQSGGGTGTNPNDGSGSGAWDWLTSVAGDVGKYLQGHAGDILKTGGTAANAYLDYTAKQQAIKERQREFDLQNQINQGNQAMMASSQLNRAPLADKAQYLALNNAAPTAFHPRDYTQGLGQIAQGQQAQGGAAAQLAANNAAASNYKAGMGGVNTDTLKMILSRIGLNSPTQTPPAGGGATLTDQQFQDYLSHHSGIAGAVNGTQVNGNLPPGAAATAQTQTTSTPPTHSTTTNYGGQQYTPDQWAAYLAQHPEMKQQGY